MPLTTWIGAYAVAVLACVWLIRWGAERLEGTFASGFLCSWFAPQWSADGIKVFGWCATSRAALYSSRASSSRPIISRISPRESCGLA